MFCLYPLLHPYTLSLGSPPPRMVSESQVRLFSTTVGCVFTSVLYSDSVIRWLKLRKPIAWSFALSGNNVHVYNITLDASYDLSVNPAL
jgi:hypothetical protein